MFPLSTLNTNLRYHSTYVWNVTIHWIYLPESRLIWKVGNEGLCGECKYCWVDIVLISIWGLCLYSLCHEAAVTHSTVPSGDYTASSEQVLVNTNCRCNVDMEEPDNYQCDLLRVLNRMFIHYLLSFVPSHYFLRSKATTLFKCIFSFKLWLQVKSIAKNFLK